MASTDLSASADTLVAQVGLEAFEWVDGMMKKSKKKSKLVSWCTPVVVREISNCAAHKLIDGVTFGARSKSGASSIGIRTACSNTDAGPAVPAVAALLRCTDGIPSAHVRNRRIPFRPTLAGPNQRK